MRLIDRFSAGAMGERADAVSLFESWKGDPPTSDAMSDFDSYVNEAYLSHGLVFALIGARARLLSEVDFRFRRDDDDVLFSSPALAQLKRPGDMVFRMEQDASLAGNAYQLRTSEGLQRLNPGKMQVVSDGGKWIAGYFYWKDGIGMGNPVFFEADDVAHWAPVPDPLRPFMGMSWLTPVASEILGDGEMEAHRRTFFANAAVPNMIVKVMQLLTPDARKQVEDAVAKKYSGENAYKTMVIDQGADVQVVGSSFNDMQFVDLQAAGELRLCQAAGVPPQLVATALGLNASTFTNSVQSFRFFADGTIRPLWRSMAAALETVVDVPPGVSLWYDDSAVPALQQDAKDAAEILDFNARTITALGRGGWTPESSRDAIAAGNLGLLEHSGLIPTTLQTEDDLLDEGDDASDEDATPNDVVE